MLTLYRQIFAPICHLQCEIIDLTIISTYNAASDRPTGYRPTLRLMLRCENHDYQTFSCIRLAAYHRKPLRPGKDYSTRSAHATANGFPPTAPVYLETNEQVGVA